MTTITSTRVTPLYSKRRRRNVMTMGLAYGATAFGLSWLVLILGDAAVAGFQRPVAGGVHRDDAAARLCRRVCSIRSSAVWS